MAVLKPKSFWIRPLDVERSWHHVDAAGQTLGKVAVKVARVLMGKHRPTYTPGVDCGEFVLITNAGQVRVSGRKREQKVYRFNSGRPGGMHEISFEAMMAQKPSRVIELAVRRMLPKNKLGRQVFRRLKVYDSAEHPHAAQRPAPLRV